MDMEMDKVTNYGKLIVAPDGKVTCHLCGKSFHDLAKHVRQKHEITADQYRERFGLNKTQALISKESANKRREAVLGHPGLVEELTKQGEQFRFSKGCKIPGNKEKREQYRISQSNKVFSPEAMAKLRMRSRARRSKNT